MMGRIRIILWLIRLVSILHKSPDPQVCEDYKDIVGACYPLRIVLRKISHPMIRFREEEHDIQIPSRTRAAVRLKHYVNCHCAPPSQKRQLILTLGS